MPWAPTRPAPVGVLLQIALRRLWIIADRLPSAFGASRAQRCPWRAADAAPSAAHDAELRHRRRRLALVLMKIIHRAVLVFSLLLHFNPHTKYWPRKTRLWGSTEIFPSCPACAPSRAYLEVRTSLSRILYPQPSATYKMVSQGRPPIPAPD